MSEITIEALLRFARFSEASRGRESDEVLAITAMACARDVPLLCDALDAANLALARAVEERDELQRRITGALRVIDRAGPSPTPGATGALLTSVRLVLESGRDRDEVPS